MTRPGPLIEAARWDPQRRAWRLDALDTAAPEERGFIAWGGGTFGAGRTEDEALADLRAVMAASGGVPL